MSGLDMDNIKFYAAVSADGGDIDLSNEQTSGVVGNEISTISARDLSTGTVRYSKQFVRNENAVDWNGVRAYISPFTARFPNTSISISLAGTKSKLRESVELSGSATVTATGYFQTSADLSQEVRPGERVYNSDDDLASVAGVITSVAPSYIQIAPPYLGTTGSGKQLSVAPATMNVFVDVTDPLSEVALHIDVASSSYTGVWKKYTVGEGCPAFSNDWFSLVFEMVS